MSTRSGAGPLVFGRDAACDVVIESTDVSRRHAFIAPAPEGYVLEDTSANGVLVNGERIAGRRALARGDVLRFGTAEFRFYAEAAPGAPPPGAAHRLFDTVHGIPAMVPAFPSRPTAPPPLATVLVRSGALRGQRLPIRTPVVNIGRADYNDLVFGEESVSASHAKLQRREEVWMLTDLDSTNGTFVDGDQVRGEVPADARLHRALRRRDGAVRSDRRPRAGAARAAARGWSGPSRFPTRRACSRGRRPPPPAERRRVPRAPARKRGLPAWALALAVGLAALAAVAAFYFFGR